jgi:SAM-dependent methyltransferase
MMRAPRRRTRSLGWLDAADVAGDELRVRGWVLPLGGAPITRVDFALGGQPLLDVAVDLGLPSPDVAKVHPNVPGAESCRFQAVAHGVDGGTVRHSMLAVTPVMADVEGTILYRFPDERLPRPSEKDILAVGGAFENVALEFLGLFVQLAGLEPGDAVLDVGCGFGRIAYALAYYLDENGRYEGFDVMRDLVDWASRSITPRFPRFGFRCVDIQNRHYNPKGRLRSESFVFPYESASFDLVFLTSVFTHLHGGEVRRYLDEVSRTLKPGGVCAATCFLLDDEARGLIAGGRSTQALDKRIEDFYTTNEETPEVCIGYDPAQLLGWTADRGLQVVSTYPGSWCGRAAYTSYQDLVIARK